MSDGKKKSGAEIIQQVVTDVGADALAKAAEGGTEDQVAAAMVVSAIKSGIKNVGPLAFDLAFRSPADRRIEAMRLELDNQLGAIGEEVAEKVQALVDDPEVDTDDLVTNLSVLFRDWQELYSTASTSHMHRLILAVLVNSVRDKEAYESGVRRRVFRVLKDLDYAEVRFLAHAIDTPKGLVAEFFGGADLGPFAAEIRARSNTVTEDRVADEAAKALYTQIFQDFLQEGMEHKLYLDHLVESGLVLKWNGPAEVQRTWLGDQVIRLCRDTESLGRTFREYGANDGGPAESEPGGDQEKEDGE